MIRMTDRYSVRKAAVTFPLLHALGRRRTRRGQKKSAPAHKNQDAGKTEKVPPYPETSFRWAGVSLCIVGLTPFLSAILEPETRPA